MYLLLSLSELIFVDTEVINNTAIPLNVSNCIRLLGDYLIYRGS